ncbi:MAG: tetratricopeptide repeat protein, partial [Armatimonadota bacterium]
RRAVEIDPSNIEALLRLVAAENARGNLPRAQALCREVLARDPDSLRAVNSVGLLYAKQGGLLDARRKALDENPDAQFRRKKVNEFIAAGLKDFVRSGPADLAAARDEKWQEAEGWFHRARQLRPGSPEVHTNLGSLARRRGDLSTATRCYARAMALDPMFAQARRGLANVLRDQQRYAEAVEQYELALELDPTDKDAYGALADTYDEMERPAYAERMRIRYEI